MKRFHQFRLDITNQCLWRGEERLSLAPKAFDLLRYLVDHANRPLVPPVATMRFPLNLCMFASTLNRG